MLLLFPLLFSCSMADDASGGGPGLGNAQQHKSNKGLADHDAPGAVQNEILEAFIAHGDTASTIGATLKLAAARAAALPGFNALAETGYLAPSETRIAYLTDGVPGRLDDVIFHSALSDKAKLSLTNFCASLSYYRSQKQDYGAIATFIASYEASILADATFGSKDQKVLLTAASLSRHAFKFAETHKKRKPRDRDWDISVGHIAIAIDLGDGPPATAALACAAALLQENY